MSKSSVITTVGDGQSQYWQAKDAFDGRRGVQCAVAIVSPALCRVCLPVDEAGVTRGEMLERFMRKRGD